MRGKRGLAGLLLLAFCTATQAEILVGINLSASGLGAEEGVPAKQAVLLWPRTLGDEIAHYILLDDASDPTIATQNIQRLIDEQQVDVIVGPNLSTTRDGAIEIAQRSETPLILLTTITDADRSDTPHQDWVFPLVPERHLMARGAAAHMQRNNHSTVAFFGLANAYGNEWYTEFAQAAAEHGLQLVTDERYQPGDSKLIEPASRVFELTPDAVLIGDRGTSAAMAHKALRERGYTGPIYHTDDIAVPEFLQVFDSAMLEGAFFPASPAIVARDLPAGHAVKNAASDFVDRYEARYGPNSITPSAAEAWSAWVWLNDAVRRAKNLGAQPGTPEFRGALRKALNDTRELALPIGVLTTRGAGELGYDERARVIGTIRAGTFTYSDAP